MHGWIRIGVSAAAVLLFAAGARAEKKYKDNGEYDVFNAAAKAVAASDFTGALARLEAWKQKYPATEFEDDRQALYIQAFAGAKQPDKAVQAAAGLLAKDIDAATGGPANTIRLLFTVVSSIQQVAEPAPEVLATGEKAANLLAAYDRKPEGLADAAWSEAKAQLRAAARSALLYISLAPGARSMRNKDYAAAEMAFLKTLERFPESAQASWWLGSAQISLYRTQPEKASPALYSLARAAAVDPAKGMVDPKWQQTTVVPYLENLYSRYHGPDPEGLKQLRALAAGSPLPPPGFEIKSLAQIAHEKELEFEKSNPQLALWMKIKGALAGGGEQYFASSLKDAAVPRLRGVLLEARPACRPKELLVAVPLPDSPRPLTAEIELKLDKPLAGRPERNGEFQWQGVPSAFTPSPLLLTMATETATLEGLHTSPCSPPPAKKAPLRKKK